MRKRPNQVSFTVRLDLNIPAEKQAWDTLHRPGSPSHRQQIVQAINSTEETEKLAQLRQIIREELQSVLGNLKMVAPAESSKASAGSVALAAAAPTEDEIEENLRASEVFLSEIG